MVGEDDHQEYRAVAEKADRLWALHGGKQHVLSNIAEDPEPVHVAAVSSGARGGKTKRGRGVPSGQATRSSAPKGGQQATPAMSLAAMARMGTGLCHFHWSFGDKASKCEAPCNWQGNKESGAASTPSPLDP